jgi:tight adherence protein B
VLTAVALAVLAGLVWPARAGHRQVEASVGSGRSAHDGRWGGLYRLRLGERQGRRSRHPWVADFAEVVVVGLEAGLDLGSAAMVSARSPALMGRTPWLHGHLTASIESGRAVSTILEAEVDLTPGERRDLGLLVSAWRLAEDIGAPTAGVTAAAAASIRGRHAAVERTAVVASGPRASMWLLSALPLAGPVAATLVGIGPARLYATGPGRLLAATGLLLTAAGWWWARSLLRRAERAGRTDGTVA